MESMKVTYRKIKDSEVSTVCALVSNVFVEYVSSRYSNEGIEEFFRYANADGMAQRSHENHFILVALHESQIIGMIEVRDFKHISLLFVASAVQRKGIGRALIRNAAEICLKADPSIGHMTVNSSPNAVDAYRAFGFQETNNEQERNGIRFIPMEMLLANIDGA
jgi:predicted GNAT family N-acyltransferase